MELTTYPSKSHGKLHHAASDEVFVLKESSVLGRSHDCTVPIPDPRVSRRHAMIRRQDDGFWFFDLGSINGSQINGRRVTTAQLLTTGDVIQIANHSFRFVDKETRGANFDEARLADQTMADVQSCDIVILVSDIQGFTTISERLTPDRLSPIIGSWYARTEDILERHGATLDKFIGDCVLAYWLGTSLANRLSALKAAHEMRQACKEVQNEHRHVLETTRISFGSGSAVHMGPAAYGTISSRGFSLLGDTVNLAFRLEALTRKLDQHVLLSAELLSGWDEALRCCRSLGSHPVKGRDQLVEVYALERDPALLEAGSS